MAKGYQHLTYKQRCQIAAFLQNGKYYYSQAEIARFIRVDKSAISRELQRNSGRDGYDPNEAQRKTEIRRSKASSAVQPRI